MFSKIIVRILNNILLCIFFLHALLYLFYVTLKLIYISEIEISIQNKFIQEIVAFIILGIGGSILKDYLLLMTICFVFFVVVMIKNKNEKNAG